jgi:uncharacterized protein YegL
MIPNRGSNNKSVNFTQFDNDRFQRIVQKYEINREFAEKLHLLNGFETVLIFDDSGSMNSRLNDSPLNKPGYQAMRWDELKAFASISVEILTLFDTNGCDIHFLNRPPMKNVTSYEKIIQLFHKKPSGYTPLTRALNSVLNENRRVIEEEGKNLLILIVTDGEPTDDRGHLKIKEFYKAVAQRQPINKIFINIIACTDDDDSISYLNNMDHEIANVDVVDDYRNERNEVKAHFGGQYPFSYGDYVVKSLVGSIDPQLDSLDGF